MNVICERVIGTIRRECLDWLIPLSESTASRIFAGACRRVIVSLRTTPAFLGQRASGELGGLSDDLGASAGFGRESTDRPSLISFLKMPWLMA
jgi:hypothetical protein